MNNSLDRLIEGMIEALRHEVIPHTSGDYSRGQAYGVIFLLETLKKRAAWSHDFLAEQVAALAELAGALDAIDLPPDAPRPTTPCAAPAVPTEAMRDAGDAQLAALIDWLADNPHPAADTAIDAYLKRQLRHEIATSAKPMFAEISLGREPDQEAQS